MTATADDVETRRAEETGKRYAEYETLAGRVYKDVLITKITDAGISISHADGVARLEFDQLSPEQKKRFGITKEGAAEIYAQEMKRRAAYEAEVAELQKAQRELLAKQTAARIEAERLAAEKALQEKKEVATTVVSTVEIPTFPTIKRSETGVIYPSRRYTPSRSTYYYGGGYYTHPASYGYYHGHYPSYYHPRVHCNSTHRGSIFHFTIK